LSKVIPMQEEYEAISSSAEHGQMADAISAAVLGAHAALNWLRADPPDLKEVQQALDGIVSAGQQAAEIAVRLRALA
jgi:hypothetical protein